MPINTVVSGAVSGWYQTNRNMRRELGEAVALIQFADLFRGAGTIAEEGATRVDVQGQWTGPGRVRIGANIQAQVSGMSIAALRIADTLGAAVGAIDQANVVTAAQNALNASGVDGLWREVTGTSP
jgi:hypothetical protein